MTIVAQTFDYVVGADTHAKTHTLCVLHAPTGSVVADHSFDTSPAGLARAITWIRRHTTGQVLAAVEGTGSYGAALTRQLTKAGWPVCDVRPPRRSSRRGRGKSDQIDAEAAARTALATDTDQLAQPRRDGPRAALRTLTTARRLISTHRTANICALTALVRRENLGVDARRALTNGQIGQIAAWRPDTTLTSQAIARAEATRLANAITTADQQLAANKQQLAHLVDQLAPGMLAKPGYGPVSCANILVAYSHHGRFRSEAAFASLAGTAPIQASSGNTCHHRLNRHGDRHLNQALDTIAKTRLCHHPETIAYQEKRTNQGLSYRDTKRIVKRYLARSTYRYLNQLDSLTP